MRSLASVVLCLAIAGCGGSGSGGNKSGSSGNGNPTDPPVTHTLQANVSHGSGTIAPNTGSYAPGTRVTLTASPSAGYRVAGWTGTNDDTRVANDNSVDMTENKTVTVAFAPVFAN
jgi:hypothetical protein